MTQYQQVREFMTAFGQECPDEPGIPTDSVCALRARLHREESVTEFTVACLEGDLVKAFDSILDSLVVVLGTAIAFGITEELIAKGLAEVHRSNMSKFWTKAEFSEETKNPANIGMKFKSTGKGTFICTDKSGKVIKSPSYSPANLGPILEGKV